MRTGILHRWAEVRALFEAAIERPRAERDAFLHAGGADTLVQDAVRALLASEDGATLEPAAAGGGADALPPGDRVGPYRLVRTLGRGGMGVVYLAEQAQPKRLVALKLIAGHHDAAAVARFRREADALARLSHPGIAQIFEIGADEEGRPFLAMEYVHGEPLAAHVARLDRHARLELLARIADAVDHAHDRGVVHRDVKPSNILVVPDGQPKILDFGIASLGELGGETLTATGMLLGTPSYMSPEQARGRGDVDARTDVYALGVIAYEMLADRLPVPVAGLTPLQALRRVEENEHLPLGRVDRRLRGDLETVVETALATDPASRYPNAGAFADDLRRVLTHEPIVAKRPGALHRAALFVRRHRVWTTAAAIALAALLVGTGVALYQRRQALDSAADARATRDFVLRVLSGANRWQTGRELTAVELARRALDDVPVRLKGQPRAQIEIYGALADVLAANSPVALAVEASRRRLELMAASRDYGDAELLEAKIDHLYKLSWAEDLDTADALLAQVRSEYAALLARRPRERALLEELDMQIAYFRQQYARFRATNTLQAAQVRWRVADYAPTASYYWLYSGLVAAGDGRTRELAGILGSFAARVASDLAATDPNRPTFAALLAALLVNVESNTATNALFERALAWKEGYFGADSAYVNRMRELRLPALRAAGDDAAAEALYADLVERLAPFADESIAELQPLHYEGGLVALSRGDADAARTRLGLARGLGAKLCGADSAATRAADAALARLGGDAVALAALAQTQAANDDPHAWRSRAWLAQLALQRADAAAARSELEAVAALVAARGARLEPWARALYAQAGTVAPDDPELDLAPLVARTHAFLDEGDALQAQRAAAR